MQIDLDLKTIQYMLTIEHEGSFQKAAKALYISQPALSKYIRRTEETLAFDLYDRRNGRCTLTKAGKILLDRGRKLLADYEQMIQEMREAAGEVGEVYFGWPTGYTVRYFTRLFTDLYQNKNLEAHVMEGSVEYLLSLVLKGSLDIAFVPAVFFHPDLEYTTIHREEFLLAVPTNHPVNKTIQEHMIDGRVDLSALKDSPFVMVNVKPFTEFLQSIFGTEDSLPNAVFGCKDWDSAYQVTKQGIAMTFLPHWYADNQDDCVSFYPIYSGQRNYRIFAYAIRKDAPISPEMQMVLDHVLDIYGDKHAGEAVDPQFLTLPYSPCSKDN